MRSFWGLAQCGRGRVSRVERGPTTPDQARPDQARLESGQTGLDRRSAGELGVRGETGLHS